MLILSVTYAGTGSGQGTLQTRGNKMSDKKLEYTCKKCGHTVIIEKDPDIAKVHIKEFLSLYAKKLCYSCGGKK